MSKLHQLENQVTSYATVMHWTSVVYAFDIP